MRTAAFVLLSALSSPALAGTIYTVDAGTDQLLAFDTLAQTFTVIGSLGIDFDFGSLAWDENDQVMYLSPGRSNQGLYTVNLTTGAATLIGIHGIGDLFAIEVDPATGIIYGGPAGSTSFYMFDPATATPTYLGDLGIRISGAEWDDGFGGMGVNALGTSDFYVIDPPNAVATRIGSGATFLDDGGIAYDPDTGLYWQFNWSQLISAFDPSSGFTAVSQTSSGRALDGADTAVGFSTARLRLARSAGTCPGPETFTVTGATPGGNVAFAYGRPGSFTLQNGPCAGATISLSGAHLIRMVVADATGSASISGTLPGAACSVTLQAMDMASCRPTNTTTP